MLNAGGMAEALAAMPEADAFFGKLTPELLAASRRLRWVQSPTASLEHYLFDELDRGSFTYHIDGAFATAPPLDHTTVSEPRWAAPWKFNSPPTNGF